MKHNFLKSQIDLCISVTATPQKNRLTDRAGSSTSALQGKMPLNGLRHPPANGTTGWYIWRGDDLSPAPESLKPLHWSHIAAPPQTSCTRSFCNIAASTASKRASAASGLRRPPDFSQTPLAETGLQGRAAVRSQVRSSGGSASNSVIGLHCRLRRRRLLWRFLLMRPRGFAVHLCNVITFHNTSLQAKRKGAPEGNASNTHKLADLSRWS